MWCQIADRRFTEAPIFLAGYYSLISLAEESAGAITVCKNKIANLRYWKLDSVSRRPSRDMDRGYVYASCRIWLVIVPGSEKLVLLCVDARR